MKTAQQYAALPYVVFADHIEVLLITRRRSKRWIIPKGWPENDLSAPKLAMLEAFEEAGLHGEIGKKPIARFCYVKQLDDGSKVNCNVDVFPLLVTAQYLDWPEKGQRELRWLKPKKAALLIEEKQLAKAIRKLKPAKKMKKRKSKATSKAKGRIWNKIRASL